MSGADRIRVAGVVVAAGSSRRMGGTDKLAAVLAGKPVLQWSVEALADAGVDPIVIVTAADRVSSIASSAWLPPAVVSVVAGGARRQESVAAGVGALLAALGGEAPADGDAGERAVPARRGGATTGDAPGAGVVPGRGPDVGDLVVLVHDAARPLATAALCRRVAEAAALHGAAIPVLPVAETIKRLDGDLVGETIDRENVVSAQTPQGARLALLQRAYAEFAPDDDPTWTDEAGLLEACRIAVYAIPGEPENLKVTLPADLARADALLASRAASTGAAATSPAAATAEATTPIADAMARAASGAAAPAFRVGFGTDGHPFGAGGPLMLGGVAFDASPRLTGHSDGDVALHAVADALLGAAALGDLGRMFPADHRTPQGADSRDLLGRVVSRLAAEGWRPQSVDLTIVGARPKLAARLPEMVSVIAATLGIPESATSVKASTGNLEGSEGAGRSISAHAVAVVVQLSPGPVATGAAGTGSAATGPDAGTADASARGRDETERGSGLTGGAR